MAEFWAGAIFAFIVFLVLNTALCRIKAKLGKWGRGGYG